MSLIVSLLVGPCCLCLHDLPESPPLRNQICILVSPFPTVVSSSLVSDGIGSWACPTSPPFPLSYHPQRIPSPGTTALSYPVIHSNGDNNCKLGKNLQKKASLASIQMPFSWSCPSLLGSRSALSSPTEEIPPLPMSPTHPSMNTCEPPSTASITKSSIPCVFLREFARGDVASDTWVREYGNDFS